MMKIGKRTRYDLRDRGVSHPALAVTFIKGELQLSAKTTQAPLFIVGKIAVHLVGGT